jgi:zinc protease
MERIPFEKLTLSNGLDIIMHRDRSLPVVSVNVWYHVGSKDEQPGKTGFAHLFEHLMFEGTKHHNSSHFGPLQEVGATLNGSTTTDRTNYWENVPSDYLELALWLEADRMGFLLEALDQKRLDIQRDVVKNERRQSYENRPYGVASLDLQEATYPSPHPYHWPVIGYMHDLDEASLQDAHAFYRRFYGPTNASLAIAGDFQIDEVRELVQHYFSDLPAGQEIQKSVQIDSPLAGRVERTLYDKVNLPRCYLVWAGVPRFHRDEAALAVLADIMSDGRSSRMYRTLVYEKQIAQSVNVGNDTAELAGDFQFDATIAAGHTTDEVINEALLVIEELRRKLPTQEELTRTKNRIEWNHVRQMANVGGFGGRANQLNFFNVFAGDPELLNTDIQRYLSVTAEDVYRVANTYLQGAHVQLVVMPEAAQSSRPHGSTSLDRTVQPGPSAPHSFMPPAVRRGTLPNGMEVIVSEKRGIPAVSFAVLLADGGASDPEELPGLATITGNMLQEGTKSRSSKDIAEQFEFIGSRLAVHTGREQTSLAVSVLRREWPMALNLVGDLVMHAVFPEEELSRLKKESIMDLRQMQDDATAVANRESAALLYGKESPYGHSVFGTESSLENMTRGDLLEHFQRTFSPVAATLAVAGDVSLEEAIKLAQETFGGWDVTFHTSETKRRHLGKEVGTSSEGTAIYIIDKPGAAQSVIRAGILGVPRNHPDYFTLVVLDHLFGGQFTARLNMNLRQDKGYSYGYRSSIEWYKDSSAIMAGGSVQTAVTAAAVAETLREFEEITTCRPVQEDEFRAAKAALLRGYPSTFETPWQILNHMGSIVQFSLPHEYLATYPANIDGVTLVDVRRVASERLNRDRLTVLIVGDRTAFEPALRDLGIELVILNGQT